MRQVLLFPLLPLAAALSACATSAVLAQGTARAAGAAGARVLVGPNVLVSRDGDVPHVESHAAAHPADPRRLVATAITFTRAEGNYATKAYLSEDGGQSWTDVTFRETHMRGAFDPKVAITAGGTVLHAALASGAGMLVYRSADGGRS